MRNKKPASNPKHDAIVKSLEERLRAPDRQVWTEHEYQLNGDHEADVILINFKRKYAYVIEVKKSNHYKGRKKAKEQLEYDEKYINRRWNIDRVYKFYAYGTKRKSDKLYEINYIKQ